MNIGIDARFWGLENAGLGRYTMNLVRNLEKIDKKNRYSIFLRDKYFEELNFPKNWKKVRAEYRHYSLMEQAGFLRTLERENVDLVHFLHFNVPVFYKKPFVVTVHDLLMQQFRGSRATTLPLYLYYPKHLAAKVVFRKAITDSRRIIVPSKAVKKEVCDYFHLDGKKVSVIYESVSPEFAGFANEEVLDKYQIKRPFFIYAGNAYPHKNLERTIKAVSLLNHEGETAYFYLSMSRNVFSEKVGKLITEAGAKEYVSQLGFVPDEDLRSLFYYSVGFLYPSLSEGFGLQGLEAMKAGTVVLASDIPVFREIYKDAYLAFDPYKISSIKSCIKRALSLKKDERGRYIEMGKALVKRYSWSKMAKKTLEIYENSARLR